MSTTDIPSTEIIDGKYRLIRLIGRGGMGSVWEGQHIQLGRRVAIKFIEADHANSAEAVARFDNEAKAAAAIQSKYAISIEHHGVTPDGRPFIVMEFLSGEPLDKRLEKFGRLSLQDTARIIQQVSRGLAKAHERGIIHRDLKPENIFLVADEEDGSEIAKVLDFGIAKIKTDGLSISNNTRTGAILGTPYFMSPEQARGLRDIDHRADIWSLGVIAYRCVTGKLPFDGESVGDLLVKICVAPLPMPSLLVPTLPQTFDAWFARALEREPSARFPNVSEAAHALAECAGITVRRSNNNPMPAAMPPSAHTAGLVPPTTPSPGQGAYGTPPPGYPYPGATPAPYSGTPLPYKHAVTSAGLSTSTTNLQTTKARGRGIIFALAAIFVLLGAGATVFGYLAFFRKPAVETTPVLASTPPPGVPSSAEPTASLALLAPDPTLSARRPGTGPGPGAAAYIKPGTKPTATTTAALKPTASVTATVPPIPVKPATTRDSNPSGL